MVNPVLLATGDEPALGLVILLGVGIVFVGLVCIIAICYLMSFIVDKLSPAQQKKPEVTPAPAPATAGGAIANRSEIVAAVCAAVAEEEGTDISAIRVISFKKL